MLKEMLEPQVMFVHHTYGSYGDNQQIGQLAEQSIKWQTDWLNRWSGQIRYSTNQWFENQLEQLMCQQDDSQIGQLTSQQVVVYFLEIIEIANNYLWTIYSTSWKLVRSRSINKGPYGSSMLNMYGYYVL